MTIIDFLFLHYLKLLSQTLMKIEFRKVILKKYFRSIFEEKTFYLLKKTLYFFGPMF